MLQYIQTVLAILNLSVFLKMDIIIFTLKQYLRYDIMLSFTKTRFHIFFIKTTNILVSQRGDCFFFSKSKICGFSQMSELKL